jgi:hypothetical protein
MDGILMKALHGNLNQLSDESMKKLVNYYATGILTLRDHYLLLSEIIGPEAWSQVLRVPG